MKTKIFMILTAIFLTSCGVFNNKEVVVDNDKNPTEITNKEKENTGGTGELAKDEEKNVKNDEKEMLKEIIDDDEQTLKEDEIDKTIEELTQDFDEDEELDIESILNIKYE